MDWNARWGGIDRFIPVFLGPATSRGVSVRNARRSMVAALVVGASLASFGLIQSVGAANAAAPRPLYGVAEGAKVTILDAAYDPAEVTVTAGQAVSWKNGGQQPHTVTAEDGSFDSGPQDPGKEWSHF